MVESSLDDWYVGKNMKYILFEWFELIVCAVLQLGPATAPATETNAAPRDSLPYNSIYLMNFINDDSPIF